MNIVPQAQRELYRQEGYMILPGVIPADLLTMLREECSYYLGYYDSLMDTKGVQSEGITHRGKRYFINTSRVSIQSSSAKAMASVDHCRRRT